MTVLQNNEVSYDLVIIGAGIGGLIASRYAKDAGLNFITLEKQSHTGGLWRKLPAWQDLQMRKEDWAIEGTSIRDETQPSVAKNIEEWVTHFNLSPFLRFETEVTGIENQSEGWTVRTKNGAAIDSRNVIVATGAHNKPYFPSLPKTNPQLQEYHSSQLFEPESLTGKVVAVLGAGASAMDLMEQCFLNQAKEVHWIYRQPKWMIPTRSSKYRKCNLRDLALKQLIGIGPARINHAMNKYLGGRYQQLGIESIRPEYKYDILKHQLPSGRPLMTKNFARINRHQGEIHRIVGNEIFVGPKPISADVLLYATGYKADLSFLALPEFSDISSSAQLQAACGSLCKALAYDHLYFLATVLDGNGSSPQAFSILAKTIISEMEGKANIPQLPITELANHWDLILRMAKFDRATYPRLFWRLKYFALALLFKLFPNMTIKFYFS